MCCNVYRYAFVTHVQAFSDLAECIASHRQDIDRNELCQACQHYYGPQGSLPSQLMNILLPLYDDPLLSLLDFQGDVDNKKGQFINNLFDNAREQQDAEVLYYDQ